VVTQACFVDLDTGATPVRGGWYAKVATDFKKPFMSGVRGNPTNTNRMFVGSGGGFGLQPRSKADEGASQAVAEGLKRGAPTLFRGRNSVTVDSLESLSKMIFIKGDDGAVGVAVGPVQADFYNVKVGGGDGENQKPDLVGGTREDLGQVRERLFRVKRVSIDSNGLGMAPPLVQGGPDSSDAIKLIKGVTDLGRGVSIQEQLA
jgi:hypothetical protein